MVFAQISAKAREVQNRRAETVNNGWIGESSGFIESVANAGDEASPSKEVGMTVLKNHLEVLDGPHSAPSTG